MKRFHVFASARYYYPGLAHEDYKGSHETLEEAKASVTQDICVIDGVSIMETQADGSLKAVATAATKWKVSDEVFE